MVGGWWLSVNIEKDRYSWQDKDGGMCIFLVVILPFELASSMKPSLEKFPNVL